MILRAAHYNKSGSTVLKKTTAEGLKNLRKRKGVLWVDVGASTIHDLKVIREAFSFHELSLEDAVTRQNPKLDVHDDYFLVILKDLYYDKGAKASQMAFFVGEDYVVTVRNANSKSFDTIIEEINTNDPKILSKDASFLAHHLMDVVVDNYFVVLDEVEDRIEALEALAASDTTERTRRMVSRLRRELLTFRKSLWPTRDVFAKLTRDSVVPKSAIPYYRDIHDHVVHASDLIEMYRELVIGAMDVHMSTVSNKMNEVMKVLTIIATIMMPMTLVTGIYGMNFRNMPELLWPGGYYYSLAFMLSIAVVMLVYFRKKKWI